MPSAGLNRAAAAAIAAALQPVCDAVGENLVVEPWHILKIAAPTLDVYPGDPFNEGLGFGSDRRQIWTVRARLHTVEMVGAQGVLLDLMEPFGDTSVEEALVTDQTLGGAVQTLGVEGPSAYTEFIDLVNATRYLGVTWRVTVFSLEPS